VSEEAIIVLEREINWLSNYERQLDRQLEVYADESKDALGARQAKESVQGRIKVIQGAIDALKRLSPTKGSRP
jgi:hypothetical protein